MFSDNVSLAGSANRFGVSPANRGRKIRRPSSNVPICRETEPATFCIGSRSSGAPTARTAAIRKGETINARGLTEMFKTIIANNRVGGWRKLTETD